jgi:hypothetical protein
VSFLFLAAGHPYQQEPSKETGGLWTHKKLLFFDIDPCFGGLSRLIFEAGV